MKTFHIKKLRGGEKSASIVGYIYDDATRRTKTIYLGSVRADANPNRPEGAVRLRPNISLEGAAVELTLERLEVVRMWLEEHGTYRAKQAAEEQAWINERNWKEIEEQSRRSVIETELRIRLEGQWRDSFEASMSAKTKDPLQAAAAAVAEASRFVVSEASRLRQEGGRLSRVRSIQLDVDQCKTELDRLQARANQLRLVGLEEFSSHCKDAGLMAAQKRGRLRTAR
jgi:hypothetical protein